MKFTIKYYITILTLSVYCAGFALANSGYADQVFLDNAVQYNEDSGVSLGDVGDHQNNSNSYNDAPLELNSIDRFKVIYYDDPNLVPSAEKEDDKPDEPKAKKKGFGFTFAQMAKQTTKKSTEDVKVNETKTVTRSRRSFGFSFSDMAKIAQKPVTDNEKINTDNNQ